MRINIQGKVQSVRTLGMYLNFNGYTLSAVNPFLTIHLEHHEHGVIILDGQECELERLCTNRISSLTPMPVSLCRQGGIQSDQAIRVVFPNKPDIVDVVERGILAAIMVLTKHSGDFTPTAYLEKRMQELEDRLRGAEKIASASVESVHSTHEDLIAKVHDLEARLAAVQAEAARRHTDLSVSVAESQAELAHKYASLVMNGKGSLLARLKGVFK